MNKTIYADLHTHTILSQHAYSTLNENIINARNNNISYVAVTDHFYYPDDKMARLNEMSRFDTMRQIARSNRTSDISIIPGIEANLQHPIYERDVRAIEEKTMWRLMGLHSWFWDLEMMYVETLPQLFKYTLEEKSRITPTAFAHIERGLFSTKYKSVDNIKTALCEVVNLAVANDIFLEINNTSLKYYSKDTKELMKFWIEYAKSKNAKFCLGTDAHFCNDVGDFKETIEFLSTIDMNNAYILNCDKDALNKLF